MPQSTLYKYQVSNFTYMELNIPIKAVKQKPIANMDFIRTCKSNSDYLGTIFSPSELYLTEDQGRSSRGVNSFDRTEL